MRDCAARLLIRTNCATSVPAEAPLRRTTNSRLRTRSSFRLDQLMNFAFKPAQDEPCPTVGIALVRKWISWGLRDLGVLLMRTAQDARIVSSFSTTLLLNAGITN